VKFLGSAAYAKRKKLLDFEYPAHVEGPHRWDRYLYIICMLIPFDLEQVNLAQ